MAHGARFSKLDRRHALTLLDTDNVTLLQHNLALVHVGQVLERRAAPLLVLLRLRRNNF